MPELRTDLEPMYSEQAAAEMLGINPRSLRTERVAGRIRFKKVAGKIYYNHSWLVEWQQKDNHSCREKVPDPNSLPLKKAGWTQSIYYIRWTENGRSRERTTGQTNLECAEAVFTDWLIARGQQTDFNRPYRPSEITIADVLNDYASDRAAEVEAPERIAYAIDALLDWWQDSTVGQIRAETCRRYARERSAATGTVRRELGVLRAATHHAVKEGRLTQTPGFWLPKPPPRRERWLTRAEAARLLKAARNSEKAGNYLPLFILLGLYTGARKEALLSLTWMQIDLDLGRIDFNPAGRIQTKKYRPKIPIPPRLLRILRRGQETATCPYVINRNGKRLKDIKRAFASAWKRAEIEEATPHVLRHTCITWLLVAGVPVWEVGGYVGATSEMIERVYGHHSPDYLRRAVEAIG